MAGMVSGLSGPLVSIIVPVFNSAHLARNGIKSFLEQSLADFEVLILDNASDDDIAEVVASFQDDRLRYIRNDSNLGMVSNFNRGILQARGKYITLISSDEMMLGPDSLSRRVEILENGSGVDFVWCAYDNLSPDGLVQSWKQDLPDKEMMTASEAFTLLMTGNARGFRITTVIMRRSIVEASGFLIPLVHSGDMMICSEWLLWSRNAACISDVLHRNIIHSTHQHDFFGSKNPFLGERDWLMLNVLDRHRARIVAMGLPWMKFEARILARLTNVVLRQLPAQGFQRFNFYLSFTLLRWLRLAFFAVAGIPNAIIFGAVYFAGKSFSATRKGLSRIPALRKLLGKGPKPEA